MSKTIGKYQIQGEVGRGGFGTVYRAWDPTVNRAVAIKVLTLAGDADLLTRFRNEAAATGNLHHRNIVTIHDFGEQDGVPYMVMQLLDGETLQELQAKKTPLTLVQKMHIMGQVADGLNYAHQHGLVHRDVKPANIMIMPDQSVQIMDFGIARVTASTSRQTRTGFVVGTVLYMAPEQFLPGKAVDHRTDIWAYGVMYYELLTGKHPFSGPDEMSTLYQVAHVEPEPVRSLAPDVPGALEEVIHRLLSKDPDLRYSSLREVNYDTQPIVVELKREQAAELVVRARQLASQEQFEEAQKTAHEILELDPSNREAHSLLQSLKQRIQRKVIQPKIQILVEKAEQDVQARAWQPALDALQSALRLSPSDTAIQARMDQIRAMLEASRKADKLVLDAQRELKARNFTAAYKIASEAAKTDPASASASHMLAKIQHEIEARANDKQRGDALAAARSMILLGEFGKAVAHLERVSADLPGDEEIESLLETGREQGRKAALTKEIEAALNAEDFGRASHLAAEAREEFPDHAPFRQLGARANEARQAFELNLAQTRIRQELDAGQLAVADEFLKVARKRFPTDAQLIELEDELKRRRAAVAPPAVASLPVAAAPVRAQDRVPEPVPPVAPAAPAIPAAARSRMPLILGSAAVVLLAIVGGVIAMRPEREAPAEPVTTAPLPSATGSGGAEQPVAEAPKAEVPKAQAPPPMAPTATDTGTTAAKPKPPAPRTRDEDEDEEPAPLPPRVETAPPPANRVGATAVSAGRILQGPARQPWTGSQTGRILWTGQLMPGSRVVLTKGAVAEGPGVLTGGDSMPPFSDVDITSISPYGNLVVAASGANLVVGNTGQAPVSRIEITWRVKP